MVCLAVRRWVVWPLQMVQKIRGRQQGKGTAPHARCQRRQVMLAWTNDPRRILLIPRRIRSENQLRVPCRCPLGLIFHVTFLKSFERRFA
jgi:hypothetical protein